MTTVKGWRQLGGLMLLGWWWGTSLAVAEGLPTADTSSAWCLRCHGMTTLGYREERTDRLVDLHIDPTGYRESMHGRLACGHCHQGRYDALPHVRNPEVRLGGCPDCHRSDRALDKYRFDKIAQQFAKSVHQGKLVAGGSPCFSCHDPHSFAVRGKVLELKERVRRDNDLCWKCHGDNTSSEERVPGRRPFAASHDWLPELRRHLDAVRCVDCHAPDLGSVVHAIAPAYRAEKSCESCHTRDSVLLTKLYRYRVWEEERKTGWLSRMMMNDAHVIGLSRHPWLDWGSLLLVVVTLGGIGLHAVGRWWAGWRRRSHG